MSERPGARIYDLGYQPYEGGRRDVAWAPVTVWVHTVQRVLGLRRPFRHKVLPGLALVIAFVPAFVLAGVAALLPIDLIGDDVLPSYGEYYGLIAMALWVFASFVAPEALCTDRRTGMLDLYLAGPLDRDRYLLAKWASVLAVMLLMTTGPQLFMYVSYTIEGAGPTLRETPELLGDVAVAGLAVALFYTAVSLGVSSFTARRGVAAVAVVLVLVVPGIVVSVAVESGGAPDELGLLQPVVAQELAWRLFDETHSAEELDGAPTARLSTPLLAAGLAGWIAAGAVVCWVRYRRLEGGG